MGDARVASPQHYHLMPTSRCKAARIDPGICGIAFLVHDPGICGISFLVHSSRPAHPDADEKKDDANRQPWIRATSQFNSGSCSRLVLAGILAAPGFVQLLSLTLVPVLDWCWLDFWPPLDLCNFSV